MTGAVEKPKTAGKRATRDAILDAAEALVRERGVNRMTLDAVAARAGFSKGGLLYNFPSKDALLKGMIERYVTRAFDGGGQDALMQMIAMRLSSEKQADDRRVGHGMLAAIAENPDLVAPVRAANKALWEAIKAREAHPDRALLAWLAVEGLGFLEMFETTPLSAEERDRVVREITAMAAAG